MIATSNNCFATFCVKRLVPKFKSKDKSLRYGSFDFNGRLRDYKFIKEVELHWEEAVCNFKIVLKLCNNSSQLTICFLYKIQHTT